MTDLDGPNPHAKLSYQDENSWGTLCEFALDVLSVRHMETRAEVLSRPDNLFGDQILSLDLFPPELYEYQAKWYRQKREKYGVPLDSRHYWAKVS